MVNIVAADDDDNDDDDDDGDDDDDDDDNDDDDICDLPLLSFYKYHHIVHQSPCSTII